MKKITSLIFFTFITVLQLHGARPAVNDVDIDVLLQKDGSASFVERWKVCVTSGTEWYLVKGNLDDIRISDFSVRDEEGRAFYYTGEWDVNWSIGEKREKCGLVRKSDGYELCWGVGSYGDHEYTVSYRMSNVVKSLEDFDCFHMQLVSPGLSSPPEHVSIRIESETPLSNINSRIWGFGFDGTIEFEDGAVTAQSNRAFERDNSAIVLIRLDKGLFDSVSKRGISFDQMLDWAMDGASFKDDIQEENVLEEVMGMLAGIFTTLGMLILALFSLKKRKQKKILGCRKSEIQWCRDLPFSGEILQSDYILTELGEDSKYKNTIAAAMILRMIKNGNILSGKDSRGRIELSFNQAKGEEGLSKSEAELYRMMKTASGSDLILQKNEFQKWSKRHFSTVADWVGKVKDEGRGLMARNGYESFGRISEDGQAEARKVLGLKKYLEDYTLLKERSSQEVILWQDYLIFAALFGIADKVAKELKEINPQAFEQMFSTENCNMYDLVIMSRGLANSITNAYAIKQYGNMNSGSSRGGFGGFTSIGGGGGFSGGGFGGGSR